MRRCIGGKYHDFFHRNLAMDSVKESMESLTLPSDPFGIPVAYTFMYVQWEANRVIQRITLLSIIATLLYNESLDHFMVNPGSIIEITGPNCI